MTTSWWLSESSFGGAVACREISAGVGVHTVSGIPSDGALSVELLLGDTLHGAENADDQVRFSEGSPYLPSTNTEAPHSVHLIVGRDALNRTCNALNKRREQRLIGLPGNRHRDATIEHFLRSLLPMLRDEEARCPHHAQYVTTAICIHMVENYIAEPADSRKPMSGGLAPWQMDLVLTYFGTAFDAPVDLEHAARLCGLSLRHFSRSFQASCGMSPYQYRLTMRIDHAIVLLEHGMCNIASISRLCGFSSPSHFANTFFVRTGRTPRAWREKHALGHDVVLPEAIRANSS
jgi:AraC-like DNA-binding protein